VNWRFNQPDQHARNAALVYAAVLLAVIGWITFSAYGNSDLRTEIAAKSDMLDTLQRRAIPDLARGGAVAANPLALISASTETIAASTLQTYVLEQLEQAGGVVQSIQAETSRATAAPAGGLHKLNAQLSFESGIAPLQKLLFSLETGTPFVFVDSLSVQPSTGVPPGGRMGDKLRVNLVLSSYWQNQPGGADK
jgi:hypothetical protein